MNRYLRASLTAGTAFAVLGPVFVQYVLSPDLQRELATVMASVQGQDPAAQGGTEGGFAMFALQVALRVAAGFLTMAAFAWLQRKRPRWRAARMSGGACWLIGYLAWPAYLMAAHGMSVLLMGVAVGYGLAETQFAAHLGALAWGRTAARTPAKAPAPQPLAREPLED